MLRGKVFCMAVGLLLAIQLPAVRTATLEGLNRPDSMVVAGEALFVVDGARIRVYSLHDFSLLRVFGSEGEGPGEVSASPFWSNQLSLLGDNLFLEGLRKYLVVRPDGRLLRESRKTRQFIKMLPVADHFVVRTFPARGPDGRWVSALKVVNAGLEDVCEIGRFFPLTLNSSGNLFSVIPDSVNVSVYRDRIYMEDSRDGFLIKILDKEGRLLSEIRKDIPAVKVDAAITRREKAWLRESFLQKRLSVMVPVHVGQGGWPAFEKWATFTVPKYLPAIRDILVKEERIFVQTYRKQDDTEEYVILDLQGNLLKKVFLPQLRSFALYDSLMLGAGFKFYDFEGDTFIYLEENEDNDTWQVKQVQF